MTPEDDIATTVFSQADANIAPDITGIDPGWSSSATLTGKKDKNAATGIVYSNIEAATDRLFALEYGTTGAKVALAPAADADDDNVNSNWVRSEIPAAYKYTGGTTGGSIQGSFRGVEGTFTCTGTACPDDNSTDNRFPARRTDGTLIGSEVVSDTDAAVNGTWTFAPMDEAAVIKVADNDYLSFGYWLSTNKAGYPVGFAVWYEGSDTAIAAPDAIVTLDEKVTYEGAAAGKYVTMDAVANTASAGYFTASAKFTADFTVEETTSPTDFADTISGTISSFMDADSTPLGDLKLSLKGGLIHTVGEDGAPDSLTVGPPTTGRAMTATTDDGRVTYLGPGGWEARFFGKDKNTNVPTGIAGAFNATIGTEAIVVGGFGAEQTK